MTSEEKKRQFHTIEAVFVTEHVPGNQDHLHVVLEEHLKGKGVEIVNGRIVV